MTKEYWKTKPTTHQAVEEAVDKAKKLRIYGGTYESLLKGEKGGE